MHLAAPAHLPGCSRTKSQCLHCVRGPALQIRYQLLSQSNEPSAMTHALCCCSDLPSLLDEWATSLFRELDYVREAQNGMRFKQLFGDLEVSQQLSSASCQMSD